MKTRKLIEAKGLLKVGDKVKLSVDNFMSWWKATEIETNYVRFHNKDFDYGFRIGFTDRSYIQFRDEASTDIEDLAEGDIISANGDKLEVIQVIGSIVVIKLPDGGEYIHHLRPLIKHGWKRIPTKTEPEIKRNHDHLTDSLLYALKCMSTLNGPETVKIGEQRFLKSDIEKLTPVK